MLDRYSRFSYCPTDFGNLTTFPLLEDAHLQLGVKCLKCILSHKCFQCSETEFYCLWKIIMEAVIVSHTEWSTINKRLTGIRGTVFLWWLQDSALRRETWVLFVLKLGHQTSWPYMTWSYCIYSTIMAKHDTFIYTAAYTKTHTNRLYKYSVEVMFIV